MIPVSTLEATSASKSIEEEKSPLIPATSSLTSQLRMMIIIIRLIIGLFS
jgi:hypothetical protein